MSKLYNLKDGSAQRSQFANEGLFPGLTIGQQFFVDPANGNNANDGRSPDSAVASIATAHGLCTANQNDVVYFIGGPTGDTLTVALTWSKSYTHLIGLSADLPGLGQRCRVLGGATTDLTNLVTFSGNGCIVKNIQFYNGADADADNTAATISGDRCHFINCFFAGMQHATPAARPGSSSAVLSSAVENMFEDCTFGTDTILRSAASAELVMVNSSKNTFRRCRFMTKSETAGTFLVSIDRGGAGINFFEECLFHSQSVNWAAPIDNAFTMIGTNNTHYVDLYRCRLVGIDGWADVVTHIYTSDPLPHASAGVPTNPTT